MINVKIFFNRPEIVFGFDFQNRDWRRHLCRVFYIVIFPITPILIYIQKELVYAKIDVVLAKQNPELFGEFKHLKTVGKLLTDFQDNWFKLELGVEVMIQMATNLTLIAFAR